MKTPGHGGGKNAPPFACSPEIDVSQLAELFETWPHAVYALDRSGQYVFQNAADLAAFGNLEDKVAGDVSADAATQEQWTEMHNRALHGETITYSVTRPTSEGPGRDAEVTLAPWRQGEKIIGIFGMTIDRSHERKFDRERQAAAETVRQTHARLQRLADNVPGGIFEFQIDPEGNMCFSYASSGLGPLLGTTTQALLEDPESGFVNDHPDDAHLVQEAIAYSFRTLEPVKMAHRIIHPELGLRWHRVHATPERKPDGRVVWYGCIFDITEEMLRAEELEAARKRMETLSLIDPLTGIANRRACDRVISDLCADPAKRSKTCTIIRIDLDHFKAVNDTLGHAAGDAVLCRVGECLREAIGPDDFTARLGGDEFVIILGPGKTTRDAEAIVQKLRGLMAVPLMHHGRYCRFDASFGIASSDILPDDPMNLLGSADAALLQAKAQGRGRLAVFTTDLHNAMVYRKQREAEIGTALERDEFIPFFQPQIDAVSGSVAGFEVLARWKHPSGDHVLPIEFIPAAEQIQVVQDIDRIMFEKALRVVNRLQAEGIVIPKLSFNVSTSWANDPEIIRVVKKMRTGGTQVAFELLESIVLEEETATFARHIDLLKQSGVSIEVDDFGSGRASIIGVLKVAPDTLKIDRRLVTPMFDSPTSCNLVRAIIDIGRTLGIDITAEGVETMHHAIALRDMGCKTLQGIAFSTPIPADDLASYLTTFRPVFSGVKPARSGP
ncbi:hypothetical protein GCM10011316_33100 [Roseibium aquae]|uniref:PAS domain S-box-containing protein/diguanylate cyclase (GGDEF)-like protein n=1 Tax=Roseibium aquae TaxID=1323746 RepID=A0A916X3G8_9HYPH|nr:EAL domain-containing protein [Roseibium aquae]GGB58416.1 hypothetical protein GCM10011316_33100 [Roseibium aquae]